MVWLHTTEESLYLDIHRVEHRLEGYAVCGTLGDGREEGEVLVEVGREVEVTFLDEWLPGGRLPAFLSGGAREGVVRALESELSAMLFCIGSFPSAEGRPRRRVTGFRAEGRWLALRPAASGDMPEGPSGVAEAPPSWQAVAL